MPVEPTAYPIIIGEDGIARKMCNKCLEMRLTGEYHKDKRRSTGLALSCKHCVNARSKEWYQKNRAYHKTRCLRQKNARKLPDQVTARIQQNADYFKSLGVGGGE